MVDVVFLSLVLYAQVERNTGLPVYAQSQSIMEGIGLRQHLGGLCRRDLANDRQTDNKARVAAVITSPSEFALWRGVAVFDGTCFVCFACFVFVLLEHFRPIIRVCCVLSECFASPCRPSAPAHARVESVLESTTTATWSVTRRRLLCLALFEWQHGSPTWPYMRELDRSYTIWTTVLPHHEPHRPAPQTVRPSVNEESSRGRCAPVFTAPLLMLALRSRRSLHANTILLTHKHHAAVLVCCAWTHALTLTRAT